MSIGQGNVFRGQENKDLFFPKTIKFFPQPPDVPVVKEGWSCKGVTGVKVSSIELGYSILAVM